MNKIALILPWYGSKPWYWELFEKSAARLYMDVIVIAEKGFSVKAENFRVVEMSLKELHQRAVKALGTDVNLAYGYKLCDLRPMYGAVFADVIEEYDYWAYGDCDVVYGRKFNEFLSRVAAEDWEVATVQDKWLSGPFTILKNIPKINSLFMRAKDWRGMLMQPDNQIFDELGKEWFPLYCFKGVDIEELYNRDWTFGGVVWRSSDVRFFHEKIANEDFLGRSGLCMYADGRLVFGGAEISMFHYKSDKNNPAFTGHMFSRHYADEYVLTRNGYLPAGKPFVRMMCAFEHFIRGWTDFAWNFLAGKKAARELVSRFVRRKLGRPYWWRT